MWPFAPRLKINITAVVSPAALVPVAGHRPGPDACAAAAQTIAAEFSPQASRAFVSLGIGALRVAAEAARPGFPDHLRHRSWPEAQERVRQLRAR